MMSLKVVFLLLTFLGTISSGLKLPLKSNGFKSLELLREGRFDEFREWNLKLDENFNKNFGRFDSGKEAIHLFGDVGFSININIGTPPQTFTLIFYPLITETFIADVTIVDEHDKPVSDQFTCFNSSKSSTYKKDGHTFNKNNLLMEMNGLYGTDTFYFGDYNKLAIKNVTFGQVIKTYYDGTFGEYDGVLGLGLFHYDKNYTVDSVLQTAIKEKLVDKPIFTIWIHTNPKLRDSKETRGQVTIGDIDKEYCSNNVLYAPILKLGGQGISVFKIDESDINNRYTRKGNWNAVFDYTRAYNFVPINILKDLVSVTNGKYDDKTKLYIVDCNVKFQWTVFFNNQNVTINEKASLYENDYDVCYLLFRDSSITELDFIFGQSFTKQYCFVYDVTGNGKIGFSKHLKT